MNIIDAFTDGLVAGTPGKPQQHIETITSDVFLYTKTVYKILKPVDNVLWGNFSNYDFRKKFAERDFEWNNVFSPEIHTGIRGLRENGDGSWSLIDTHEDTDDFCTVMQRIDSDDTLKARLLENRARKEDVVSIAKDQTKNLDLLTEQYREELGHLFDMGWHALLLLRMDDLREYAYIIDTQSPKKVIDKKVSVLTDFINEHEYFSNVARKSLSVTIDNHAGNVVFINDKPQFIDIYLLKEEWRVVDHSNSISRIATCVRVLGNDELADAMYEAYSTLKELAPKEIREFYECYNAYIKAYYYLQVQPELSARYFTFADAKLEQLT